MSQSPHSLRDSFSVEILNFLFENPEENGLVMVSQGASVSLDNIKGIGSKSHWEVSLFIADIKQLV